MSREVVVEDAWTPRRSTRPAPDRLAVPRGPAPSAAGLDIPFVQLTAFFVKASLAAAFAVVITSTVWVAIAGLFVGVGVGAYVAMGQPDLFGDPMVPGTPAAVAVAAPMAPTPAIAAPPEPVPPPVVPTGAASAPASAAAAPKAVAAPVVSPPASPARPRKASVSGTNAATEALIRKQLEARQQSK
jgi:hypothetical protein